MSARVDVDRHDFIRGKNICHVNQFLMLFVR